MQRKIAILLSFLLLLNASGIGYGQHFCGDHLMKAMLAFSEATLDCGMEQAAPICNDGKTQILHKDTCCHTELHQVQTDTNFNGAQTHFEVASNFFAILPPVFTLFKIESRVKIEKPTCYYPPPLQKNIRVLYQVFLI